MSKSYRTQKESIRADLHVERIAEGIPALPRIIERKPAKGDSHPLTKKTITKLLKNIPIEYIYGLSRIELRARETAEIGMPFGCYWVGEKTIVLYSLPSVFRCKYIAGDFRRSLNQFHANLESDDEGITVTWPKPHLRSVWFYSYVFTHELGHHFVEQYKSRNSRIRSRNAEELVADLHAKRLTDELYASWRNKSE